MNQNLYLEQYSQGDPYETLKYLRRTDLRTSNYLAKQNMSKMLQKKKLHTFLQLYIRISVGMKYKEIKKFIRLFIGYVSETAIFYLNGFLVSPNLNI